MAGIRALGAVGVTWGNALLATGTFTATATSETFEIEVFRGNGKGISEGGQLNALVLHSVKGGAPIPGALKGDVNLDGIINFLDISPFILALSSPGGAPAEADCNCDGIVNFLDIAPFINKLAGGS